jgi:hypothetical protein
LSLRDYGRQAAQRYQASVKVCAPFTNTNTAQSPAGSSAKGLGNQIAIATNNAAGMDTSAGPGGGNEACAWAVNRVLQKAGVAPLGDNPNYVPSVEAALRNGRGQAVSSAQAQAGDIIIAKDQRHIGICLNEGCTRVRSNSSSHAQFSWMSSRSFDGFTTTSRLAVKRFTVSFDSLREVVMRSMKRFLVWFVVGLLATTTFTALILGQLDIPSPAIASQFPRGALLSTAGRSEWQLCTGVLE